MQPSQWIVLESLPLTESGKVDRKELINRDDQFTVTELKSHKNSIEYILCDIFRKLLNLDQIGVEK